VRFPEYETHPNSELNIMGFFLPTLTTVTASCQQQNSLAFFLQGCNLFKVYAIKYIIDFIEELLRSGLFGNIG
jgi:hypothetical protein